MDLTKTIEPKSDQLNAEDFLTGSRTFTVERVSEGSAEQPVNVYLKESPGKPWRPSKSMRRVLVALWGAESEAYSGRRLTLYRDPEVRFGKDQVGGIKVSHMSDIPKRSSLALTVKRGKREMHVVEPLSSETAPAPAPTTPAITPEQVAATTDLNELRDLWSRATPDVQALIQARVEELKAVES